MKSCCFIDFIVNNIDFIVNIINLIVDSLVLIIAFLTLYFTVFSQKLVIAKVITIYDKFHGDTFCLLIKNKSLHSIPILGIFVIKETNKQLKYVELDHFDEPIIVNPWHISKVNIRPIREIESLDNVNEVMDKSVIGIDSGDSIIWIKNRECTINKKELKETYSKYYEHRLTVYRNKYNSQYLSNNVNYAITYVYKDINDNFSIKTILLIVNKDCGLLSEAIFGRRTIERGFCNSCKLMPIY